MHRFDNQSLPYEGRSSSTMAIHFFTQQFLSNTCYTLYRFETQVTINNQRASYDSLMLPTCLPPLLLYKRLYITKNNHYQTDQLQQFSPLRSEEQTAT